MTPRKTNKNVCAVCKIVELPKGSSWRYLNSEAGLKKNLSKLLLKYGEIDVVEGVICRNCERKISSIDKTVSEFRLKCNSGLDLLRGKRCNSDNVGDLSSKRNEPSDVKAKTQLFPDSSDRYSDISVDVDDKENDNSILNSTPLPRHRSKDVTDSGYISFLTPILPKPTPSAQSSVRQRSLTASFTDISALSEHTQ